MACALFAAVSGSSPATVVAIGSILLPAMVKQGFPPRFGAGVITTSGALGILIPPSIVMVMYAVATNTSVGALFIAGIVPGIVLAILLGLDDLVARAQERLSAPAEGLWAERWRTFRESIWGLLLVDRGHRRHLHRHLHADRGRGDERGLRLLRRRVRLQGHAALEGAEDPARFGQHERDAAVHHHQRGDVQLPDDLREIPQALAAWMLDKGLGVVAFLLFVNVILLLAGNVMEPSSIVLIMAPILFPVAMKLGIDPIHFGIMMVVNMEVGMCHPPVGLNLYVASGITKMGITELTVAVWPWLLTMLVFLVIVTYWPALTLALPRALGMI